MIACTESAEPAIIVWYRRMCHVVQARATALQAGATSARRRVRHSLAVRAVAAEPVVTPRIAADVRCGDGLWGDGCC